MREEEFGVNAPGRLVRTPEGAPAFVPDPLPPEIKITDELMAALAEARGALGDLSGVGRTLPNPHLLIRPFLRKEAEASSRIEGTETDLDELFIHEADPTHHPQGADVRREVLNYVIALEVGLDRRLELPIGLRFVRDLHSILLREVRGQDRAPGEFRRVQNRIGGSSVHDATYVPPPTPEMQECISDWEKFLHTKSKIQPLIQLAMIHYQFEAIHPFVDGNGRVGRLLIPILLCEWGLLSQPLLYLSSYFERNRSNYYDLLLGVSQKGNWIPWFIFFLRGVEMQAKDSSWRIRMLLDKQEEYRQKMQTKGGPTSMALVDSLIGFPVCRSPGVADRLKVTLPTAIRAIQRLEDEGFLQEITGKQRNRAWMAKEVMDILQAENLDQYLS
ncbi:MAG: Fic family protein [bacterium]|nr:Fic family protein [bacterium]